MYLVVRTLRTNFTRQVVRIFNFSLNVKEYGQILQQVYPSFLKKNKASLKNTHLKLYNINHNKPTT